MERAELLLIGLACVLLVVVITRSREIVVEQPPVQPVYLIPCGPEVPFLQDEVVKYRTSFCTPVPVEP